MCVCVCVCVCVVCIEMPGLHMLGIGNRCLTPGYQRGRERGREMLCLYWSCPAGTVQSCGRCSTLFHSQTPRGVHG